MSFSSGHHSTTNTQSDYSRSQYTEKYIQDRVAAELTKLEKETVKRFQDTANKAISSDELRPEVSVPMANERISKLTQLLKDNVKLAQVDVGDEVKRSRELVAKCLADNEGRSLNCWTEVEEFRRLVHNL